MAVTTSMNVHLEAGDIGHAYSPGDTGFATLDVGTPHTPVRVSLFFSGTAAIDEAIAHLTSLKAEMAAGEVSS